MSLPRMALICGVCILVLTTGCSLFSGDTLVEVVPVDSIDVLSHTERSVRFAVTDSWPNTCGEVSRFESNRDDRTYRIRMYGEQPKNVWCGQAITPITGTWGTSVPCPGTYTFEFWQGDDARLDTTLATK